MMFLLLTIIALLIVYHDVSTLSDWELGLFIIIASIDFITICTMIPFRHYKRHYKNDVINSKVQTKNNSKCKFCTEKGEESNR